MTIATREREALLAQESARRAGVRALAHVAGRALLLFGIADDHLHVVVECDRHQAGRFAQAIALSLGHISAVALEAADLRPVVAWTVDRDGRTTWAREDVVEAAPPERLGLPRSKARRSPAC